MFFFQFDIRLNFQEWFFSGEIVELNCVLFSYLGFTITLNILKHFSNLVIFCVKLCIRVNSKNIEVRPAFYFPRGLGWVRVRKVADRLSPTAAARRATNPAREKQRQKSVLTWRQNGWTDDFHVEISSPQHRRI